MNERTKRFSRRDVGRGIVAAGAAAAIGFSHRRARAKDLRSVTFLLDVTPYGKHALFYPAVENGYFRDAGLDVTFQAGKGSADVAVKIAAGAVDVGFAEAPTSILARGRGAKVKQVMMVHYLAMNCATTLASNPVRKPQDMLGKKMGATAGDAPRVALPALGKINHFDDTKIELVTMESSAKPAMLMSKQVDGVLSLAAYTPVMAAAARKMNQDVVQMLFSDFGMDVYSNGIVVNDDVAARDPEMVRGFVQALVRSCIFAVEQPDEAIEIFMKHNPAANPAIARPQLDVAIKHLMVDEVKQHGVGPMSEKKMAFTLDIVREFYGLQGTVNLADVYSNEFVKAGQKPKA